MVNHPGIMAGDDDGGGPREADAQVLGTMSGGVVGINTNIAGLFCAVVVPGDDPRIFPRINDGRIGGIRHTEASFPTADTMPVSQRDTRMTE